MELTREDFAGRVLGKGTARLAVPPGERRAVRLAGELAVPADPRREVLAATADGLTAFRWWAEDRDLELRAAAPRVSVTERPGGWDVHVHADVLVKDLALLVDKRSPGASVDDMLVTLPAGRSVTFRVEGRDIDLGAFSDPVLLRSANQLVRPGLRAVSAPSEETLLPKQKEPAVLSTMQDGELSVARLLRYGTTVHGSSTVATWTGSATRRQTYRELGRTAARLAHGLRALGIDGDQRVATFMWNNSEHLQAYLAVPAMGAVLHTLNIRMSADQLTFVANHAQDRVVIVDASLAATMSELLPRLETVRHVVVANGDTAALQVPHGVAMHSYEELAAAQPDEFAWPAVDERSAAAMCYTSGTTGDPKGVVYSHRSIWLHSMQVCMSDAMGLAQSDSVLPVVPMFHAMAWGLPYAALMVGACLVLPDRFLQPAAIARILAAERPSLAAGVPTIWRGLLAHLEDHPQDLSHLRELVTGGSACPPSLMRVLSERHGVNLLSTWGMTEMSPLGTVARPPSSAGGETLWAYRSTQGRFPASVQARLVDDDDNELPWDDDSVGELEVSGPWVTGAYYAGVGQAGGGAVTPPDAFHDGWLRTGDVGRISSDGFLTLTDRSKDVIKSGGEWISSVQLENAVMAHPAVAEAAVIGIPDEKWQERPLVAVVTKSGHRVTATELRDFLVGKVASWQLPEYWSFIEEVPKTSVGKFDKKQLRSRYSRHEMTVQATR